MCGRSGMHVKPSDRGGILCAVPLGVPNVIHTFFLKPQNKGGYGRSTVIVARKESPGDQEMRDKVGVRQE